MNEQPISATDKDDVTALLSRVEHDRRAVDQRRPSQAVPLLVLGLVILGAIPFYILTLPADGTTSYTGHPLLSALGASLGTSAGAWTAAYWMVALPAAYVFCAWSYRRAAARSGVAVSVTALVTTGLGVFAALALLVSQSMMSLPGNLVIRGLTPLLIIGLGLLVWSMVERSAGLLAITLIFLASTMVALLYDVVNLAYRVGFTVPAAASLLPNLMLPAVVLLVSSAVYHRVERTGRSAT